MASRGEGVAELQTEIHSGVLGIGISGVHIPYPDSVDTAVAALAEQIDEQLGSNINNSWLALKLLEEDETANKRCGQALVEIAASLRAAVEDELHEEMDIIAADARYGFIAKVAECCSAAA